METDFKVGEWLVEPSLNRITGPEGPAHVEPKAMEVLLFLSAHPGEVISKERLIQAAWPDTFVTDEVLTNAIWELRRAFADDAKNARVIQTVYKKGYRLLAPVSRGPARGAPGCTVTCALPAFPGIGTVAGWLGPGIRAMLGPAASSSYRSTRGR